MKKFRRFRIVLYIIVILAAVDIRILYGWKIGAFFNQDKTAYDIAELAHMVNTQVDSGKHEGKFYISGITMDDIADINEYVCSVNGVVNQYTVLDRSRAGLIIILRYELSDNYYVWQKYVNGKEIPANRPAAVKLYNFIVEVLDEIITDDMSDYEKELAIHDYIVKNCEYGYVDYAKDYAYRAYGALIHKKAVCNGYAEAFSLLLNCIGVDNQIMTGYADKELHAWNRVKLDGEWYMVDTTWDDPIPDRGYNVGHTYFNVNDNIMGQRHEWNRDNFEKCTSLDYNYFVKNKYVCNYSQFVKVVKKEAKEKIIGISEVVVSDFTYDYDYSFIGDIRGIGRYSVGLPEKYGENYLLTIYLNQ